MSITLRQSNGTNLTANATGTSPAWGTTTVAGNLLILVVNTMSGTSLVTTNITGGGWTNVPTTLNYYTSGVDFAGIFWKIAAGSDSTPGTMSDTGSPLWQIYTYEFVSTTGWAASPYDVTVNSGAAGSTAANKASGSTATLAQADELAIAINGAYVATRTGFAWTGGFTAAQPATNSVGLEFGWQETAATTALSTTPTWTTATYTVSWIATFKTAAAAVGGTDAYSTVILADGPTAYYRLDDTATPALDSSGHGYSLTLGTGVTKSTTGLLNQAVSTDTAMTFPNTGGITNTASNTTRVAALEGTTISVECWVKVAAFVANTSQSIAGYGYSNAAGFNPWALYLYGSGTGTHEFVCDAAVASTQLEVISSNTYSIGTAYHLVWTFDGTTSRLYVNGVADGTSAKTGSVMNYGSNPGLVIGQNWATSSTTSNPMNGVIDELAVYANKVLTPTQILAHYTAGTVATAARVPYQQNYQFAAILAQ